MEIAFRLCVLGLPRYSMPVVSLKWKIWIVSQGLLLLTAVIIQVVFHGEILVGPFLGTAKRGYWEIIKAEEPMVPEEYLSVQADPKLYDARLPMTKEEAARRGLARHRLAFRQEEGLRGAFYGAIAVNCLYFLAFHLGYAYFRRQVQTANSRGVSS